MKHNKLKLTDTKDRGFSIIEKAELVFLIIFFVFLAIMVCAFICAGLALVLETKK